jgi:hypothetical protein
LLVSRLAVGCPLRSTLVISSGWECIALKGCCVAAGLFAFVPVVDLPRIEAVLLFVPLAGEARMAELDAAAVIGTCTIVVCRRAEEFRRLGMFAGREKLGYRHRMGVDRGLEVCRPDMLVNESIPPSYASSPHDEINAQSSGLLHINYIQGVNDREGRSCVC